MSPSSSPTDSMDDSADLRPGDWVAIQGMARIGRVLAVHARRKTARVDVAGHQWSLELSRLQRTTPAEHLSDSPPAVQIRVSSPLAEQIDLHGLRVHEALELADRALDQAVVHHLPELRIVHGHGTGALRLALREMLATHPHVAEFRFGGPLEGSLATTVVRLKQPKP